MSASISSLSSRSNREMSALVSCSLSGIHGAICRSHSDDCADFWMTLSSLTGLCSMLPKFNRIGLVKKYGVASQFNNDKNTGILSVRI